MSRYAIDPVKQRAGRVGGTANAERHRQASRERIEAAKDRPILRHAVTPSRADELRAYWRELARLAETPMPAADRKRAAAAMHDHVFRGFNR